MQIRRTVTIILAVLIVVAGWYFSQQRSGQSVPSTSRPQTQVSLPKQDPTLVNPDIAQNPNPAPENVPPKTVQGALPLGTGFDFYVVSLSWSPTWCAENPDATRTQQCLRRMGLIMHGLWPQNERGYPANCPSREPNRVPETLAKSYLDLIPSIGLIGHEWRKHGTCSGLSQRDYFATARAAREKLKLPPELIVTQAPDSSTVQTIEQNLVKLNPGMTPSSVSITCSGPNLEEVRICMTKDLKFRECGDVERSSCRLKTISIPDP